MNSDINFAVIGLGHIGKRHVDIIQKQTNARLIAVCDINPNLQNAYNVPFYTDINQLLSTETQVDVVCICTPNGLHALHSIAAIRAGKHVVCEKPMALKRADCEAIIYEALLHRRQVFCVMQNRYSPPAQWLKTLIEQGHLGKIYTVQIRCFWNRDDRYYLNQAQPYAWKGSLAMDGGVLFTQFSHFVDMLYWLFGDIEQIQAQFFNFNHQHSTEFEDSGNVNFSFRQGGAGSLQFSTAVYAQNLESSLTIIAQNGSVKVGGQYMNEVEYCHIKDYQMPDLPPSNPPNDYGTYKGSAANHIYLIDNVVKVLQGLAPITTNAIEGMKVVEIIENIYKSGNRSF